MSIETEKKNQLVQVDIEEVKSQAQALVVQNKDGEEIKRAPIVDQPTTTRWEVLMYYSNLEIDPWTFQSESGTLLGKQGWPARSILPMNFQPDSLHLLRHFSIQ